MNKKITLNVSQLVLIVIITFFLAISGFFVVSAIKELIVTHMNWVSALIGALGSILGGTIGGIFTYLIATYQIYKTQKLNEQDRKNKAANVIKLIIEDLYSNKPIVEKLINSYPDDSPTRKSLSVFHWQSSSNNIPYVIPGDLLITLNTTFNMILVIKNQGHIEIEAFKILKEKISLTTKMLEELYDQIVNNYI